MPKQLEGLAAYIGTDQVVRINRKTIDDHWLDGFIVGVSPKLLLLQLVDGNTLHLNGYSALRLSDIKSYKADGTFVSRALCLLNRKPTIPENIDLTDWPALLQSVQLKYPLLMIETEKKEPGGFVGRINQLTAKQVDLLKVSTKGYWKKWESFAFKDITQVEFGDGYVDALAQLVAHEDAAKKENGRTSV